MNARADILARIRAAQGRSGAEPTQQELEAVRAEIARRTVGPQPSISRPADPLAQFRSECDRLSTTHSHVDRIDAVPGEVARYLQSNALEARIVLWPEYAGLDWASAGIAINNRPAVGTDRTGLTGCFCAIAETGTLLLLGGRETPKATALLPETHICVVSCARLVNTMEQAFAYLRSERGELPRSTWFVSGPSRTADIEQTLVIGAHGPYRVHVILVP
ncbi:MAG: lactate utilization protein C [Usitatibacter sp.]